MGHLQYTSIKAMTLNSNNISKTKSTNNHIDIRELQFKTTYHFQKWLLGDPFVHD
ncbi:hypothetical protein HanRHA438_Chr03g0131561 [Helianthus annuus]|nr:hypothetical protein HanRHA438_Chr03g0131561 [Helianthus annuus]